VVKRRARLTDENDPLSSTDQVLAEFEQLSQSTSQPVSKLAIQPEDKSASQQANNSETQPDEKSTIRKATFQLNEAVLQQLERFHLQLQLELGKVSTPYKEVIVEEAIARLLEQVNENRDELVSALQERQKIRK
jgi:hypothetical protein